MALTAPAPRAPSPRAARAAALPRVRARAGAPVPQPTDSAAAMSLAFSPHNVVVFDITEGSAAAPGSAEGTLSVTNVAAPEAAVLLKVKTNAAERYLVHPHILLLAPGETRVITSE